MAQERIEEIENLELGQDRIKQYYELKGYPKDWIDKRLRGIVIKDELTDVLKNKINSCWTAEMHDLALELVTKPKTDYGKP